MRELSENDKSELRRLLGLVGNLAQLMSGQDMIYVDSREAVTQANRLRDQVKALAQDPEFDRRVPSAKKSQANTLGNIQSARLVANQLWAYTQDALGESVTELEAARRRVDDAERRLQRSSVEQARLQQLLESVQGAEPYRLGTADETLRKFQPSEARIFHEGLMAYSHGLYTAAVALVSSVVESLVRRACNDRGLAADGFGPRVAKLREAGVIRKEGAHRDLISIITNYRNSVDHGDPEIFTRQKADIVIGSALTLLDEVF
jgi:hypothetical protein